MSLKQKESSIPVQSTPAPAAVQPPFPTPAQQLPPPYADGAIANQTPQPNLQDMDLTALNQQVNQRLAFSWQAFNTLAMRYQDHSSPYLVSLKTLATHQQENEEEVLLPIISDVSGGKSSLINNLCRYPILPAAAQTTSICPVEIRRSDTLEAERLEVCLYSKDRKSLEKTPVKIFRRQVLSESLFEELKAYALYLAQTRTLSVNDTLDFFNGPDGKPVLDRMNWRHTMMLLMILLDTYIHQDKQDSDSLPVNYKTANEKRNALLRQIGVPDRQDYGVRLYWCSDMLPEKAAIVDLPGLGAACHDTEEQLGHTALVMNYITNTPSLILLMEGTGQLSLDVTNMLDSYLSVRTEESSARITFVINKADKYDSQAIETTINSFRQGYPQYERYPVYSISAYSGEISFIRSGIALRNLHLVKIAAAPLVALRRDISDEDALCIMETAYATAYPCQSAKDAAFGTMNLEKFLQEFFAEQVRRIRLLRFLQQARTFASELELVVRKVAMEKELLKAAEKLGPQCAAMISEAIQKAMKSTIEELTESYTMLSTNMTRELAALAMRLQPIIDDFKSDYAQLSKVINLKLKDCINSMKKNKNGTIPIDSVTLGRDNQAGGENRKKFLHLADDTIGKHFDFLSYFKETLAKLRGEFDQQQTMYNNFVQNVVQLLRDFPHRVVHAMDVAFDQALQDFNQRMLAMGLTDIKPFEAAMEMSKNTAAKLLQSICDSHAQKLTNDTTITNRIKNTMDAISSELMGMMAPYRSGNYGTTVLNKIRRARWFRADTVDMTEMTNFLQKEFLSGFSSSLRKMLEKRLTGSASAGTGQDQSHPNLMAQDLNNVMRMHVGPEATESIRQQVNASCSVTSTMFDDPKLLNAWKDAIAEACRLLNGLIFQQEGIVEFLPASGEAFADYAWAQDYYKLAASAATSLLEANAALNHPDKTE